ncbi:MAG: threonine synthase [Clostridia bacterium]|nr:threonine synthase [Clostridia bacterium]
MNYVSTRDGSIKITSATAIVRGLSADGGLFMPESIPSVSDSELRTLSEMDYRQRAKLVLSKFLTDYTAEEIENCVNGAYTAEKFGGENPVPVTKLDDNNFVLELWHGPTCAFKDMALQILPRLLTTATKKCSSDKTIVILVATSGDTGKAALEGFCDVEGTKILVFYPSDGVSEVQKKQMISQKGDNTGVMGIVGNFDDCQSGVKVIFGDSDVAKKLSDNGYEFSSANSINWGRLVPQVVYYFSAYADLVKTGDIKIGDKLDFVVPTGNFGDILAGYIAKKMGLPVGKLVCASNSNNVLTDFINTGVYDRNRKFFTTISPSMDILISSNLERLLFMMSDGDDKKVSEYMSLLSKEGKYTVDSELLEKIKAEFVGGYADEQTTVAAIADAYKKFGYVTDPHTAVAYHVAASYESENKKVILSTASPYKFPASVIEGVAGKITTEDEFELFDILNEKTGAPIPAPLKNIKNAQDRFTSKCEKTEMVNAVYDFLDIK